MRMLVSDMAGRASIELKSRELGFDLDGTRQEDNETARARAGHGQGPGTTWLHLRRRGRILRVAFAPRSRWLAPSLHGRVLAGDHRCAGRGRGPVRGYGQGDGGGERIVKTGEGNGPVNALDHALREALATEYPQIAGLELVDYKVRILDAAHGTDAVTRVLIETLDGSTTWSTIGVAANILEASWDALVESVTYGLIRAGVEPR